VIPSFLANAYRRVRDWTRQPQRRGQHRTLRLQLEQLEERNLMSVDGTWTQLTGVHAPPQALGTMMLLSDGTVMAQGSLETNQWFQLKPDASGSYTNGTWSNLPSMHIQRLYFASNVLPNGNVFVQGGEYSSAGSDTATGETYNSVTQTWSTNANAPFGRFGDDPSEVITTPDGKTEILAGYISGPQTSIYDPSTNTWSAGPTKLRGDASDEEAWTKLPNGDILSWDVFASISMGVFHAQIYDPSTNTWSDASSSSDGSTLPLLSSTRVGYELGPGILLPDGRVLQLGANGNTALYDYTTNTWTAGPQILNNQGQLMGADDAPAAILPDGQVIFAADAGPTRGIFSPPTDLFDFDPTSNTITQLTLPTNLQNNLNGSPSYTGRMLVLPSGQLLYTTGSQVWAFMPNDSADPSWQPTITDITDNGDGTFTLTGTQLNGISEGAAYGDDAEMAENYPIVQFQGFNGNVFYARTSNWSSTGVSAVGDTTLETVTFTLPSGLAPGDYLVSSIANGISSYPLILSISSDDVAAEQSLPDSGGTSATPVNGNLPLLPASSQPASDAAINAGGTGTSFPSTLSTATSSDDSSVSGTSFLMASPTATMPPLLQTLDATEPAASSNAFSPSVTYLLGKGESSVLSSLSMGASKPATCGRFKTSQGLEVHGPRFFLSQD
jgi:hypothetical protein